MSTRSALLPAALLLLVTLGGVYVRLVDLGQPDFYNDELYIVYAAESLNRGEGPLLPSGERYGRGLDVTRMVAFSLERVDRPELAARLPSAFLGILGLVLFAAVAWAMAGPWAAVWATLLLAIYPEAISQARITRFYTYQLLFGLVALYAGWQAVRTAGSPVPDGRRWARLRAEWGWLLLAIVALAMAARIQATTLSIIAAWGACVGLGAIVDLVARRGLAWRESARVQATVLGLAGLVIVLLANPGFYLRILDLAGAVPAWAGGAASDARGYYWALTGAYPVIVALLPVLVAVTAFRDLRLAVFLAVWFLLPFMLHSLVLPWKAERYVLLAMPALFLLAAVPAALGSAALFRRIRDALAAAGRDANIARGGAAATVAVAVTFLVLTTPAFNTARKIPPFVVDLHWRAAYDLIQALPADQRLVLGSSYPIDSLYYWERVDFGVATVSLERVPLPEERRRGWQRWVRYEDGVPDFYSAAPILTRPEAIRDRFPDAGAAVIAIDRAHVLFGHVDRALLETLSREAVELCEGACGRMLLYYWSWDREADPEPLISARSRHPGGARGTVAQRQPSP